MSHITIRNFGPIKDIALPIKKYNIFIGNSGTGKSTLAKVICNAQWLEKELFVSKALENEIEGNPSWYIEQLTSYHHIDYYQFDNTFIEYRGDFLSFTYNAEDREYPFRYEINRDALSFKRHKTLYIPAERNMVAVIPNWFDIKLPQNNLRAFLSAWQECKISYTPDRPLTIAPFNAQYHTSKDGVSDMVSFANHKSLTLSNVASGIQSAVPLIALISYFTNPQLLKKLSSVTDRQNLSNIIEMVKSYRNHPDMEQLEVLGINSDGTLQIEGNRADFFKAQFENLVTFKGTRFFIEEPELSLFPHLQYELFKEIIKAINSSEHNSLTITTHSPYILSFISNYIYAHYLQKTKEIDVSDIVPAQLMIDGDNVTAYYLADGTATDILSKEPSLGIEIKDLDAVSDEIGSLWDNLLNRELKQ